MTLNKLIKILQNLKDEELNGNGEVEILVLSNYPDNSLHYFNFTSNYKTRFNVRHIDNVSSVDRLDGDVSIVIG